MEDLYGDLENYNEVDLVNELKTQNTELKQKLGECLSSMDTLQKDFDKLSSEFKLLETNYSSLLKIARAEIKRKTDMITNLNIEKDMLLLKQYNTGGRKKQFDVNNTQNIKRGRNQQKKAKQQVQGLKQNEINRKECDRLPSEASSTTTDRSNGLTIVENRNLSKPNENLGEDVFPDSGDYHSERFLDKRVSMLTSHQFTKFSSDEEFEDMYSALEPKESSKETSVRHESDRSRKRMRDDPQPNKNYYDTFAPHDKRPSYSEPYRENFSRNKNSRYYENDRGIHRDRDEYDLSRSHRNKHSPDRHRRGRRDLEEDRPVLQRERQRRLESPPRGRYQHKSRERRAYPDRERTDQKSEMLRHCHSDPHIIIRNVHGEYDEPLNKRPRVEHYPHPKTDRQFLHDQPPAELGDRTSCQSPDNLHSEYILSNEPIREIRSTAITKLDDPRVSSGKYKKDSVGNKDVLCIVSSNEIILQPVNKTLWQLEKDKQQQLLPRPTHQISAELVNEIYMDIDNPAPDIALEPNYDNDVTDCQDESNKNQKTADLSPVAKNDKKDKDMSVSKHDDIKKVDEKVSKSVKYKIPKVKKADIKDSIDEPSAKTSSKTDKADKVTHRSKHIEALQENHHLDKITESIMVHDSSKSLEEKLENMSLPELQTLKAVTNVTIQREFEHKVYSIRHIVEGDLELSDETKDETQADVKAERASQKKSRTRKKSHRDSSKEKISDGEVNTRKTKSKKEKEMKCDYQKPEMLRHSHSDPHIMIRNIHGEYDESLNKRQIIEHYPHPVASDDRRKTDIQFLHDKPPAELGDRTSCQSPDNLHSEYILSNEPIREIRSTAIKKLDDPRVSSGKYKKDSVGNKDVLWIVSSNEMILQPVNKTLWQLEKDKQQQLLPPPSHQISAELVNEIYMDIDNPAPDIALEPNYDDDVTDCQDESNKNQKTADLSPVAKNDKKDKDMSVSKHDDIKKVEEKVSKSVKYKIPKVKKDDIKDSIDEPSAKTSSKTNKADKVTHRSKHIESLQENHHLDKITESIMVHDSSKSLEEKLENMSLPELQTLKAVTNVTIQSEFEHKVYSIRQVEGDLELSDETNDETQADVKAERASQKKSRTRKKSHRDSSKEKISDGEVNTGKTKSKKEKEKEMKCDKFSELFGDSSSLITPEELALATAQAHAEPYAALRGGAEPYGAVGEDAQHAIHTDPARDHPLPTLTPVTLSESDDKTPNIDVQIESSKEDTRKTKASKDHKMRTRGIHTKLEHTRNESVKDKKEDKTASTDEGNKPVNQVPGSLKLTIKMSGFREKFDKESNSVNKPTKKSKHVEETNVPSLSNKKNPSVDESLLSTKQTMDCITNKDVTIVDFQKSVSPSENKENASSDTSKGGNNDMPQFFDETVVPDENMSFANKGNEEKQVQETICSARVEDTPNLVPDKDEHGLVKTVVISTGVQPIDPTLYQLSTTESTSLKALATSTPAKELYETNSFNETGSSMNSSADNGKATINGSVTQSETQDTPDIRINYYRRRRKVVKKQNSS